MNAKLVDRSRFHWAVACLVGLISPGCNPPTTPLPAPEAERIAHPIPTIPPQDKASSLLPQFDDVAADLGIVAPYYSDTVPHRFFLPEVMGGGATWLDFDRDGRLDLYLTNGTHLEATTSPLPRGNWLYRGRSGASFQWVPESWGAGDTGYGQGSAAGDFNSDGFPDLYVGNYGPNALYVNEGDGTFSRDDSEPSLADPAWTSSVVWADLNRDGLLDLYVTNYLQVTLANRKVCEYNGHPGYCGPGQYDSAVDHAYVNQGDGTFIESASELGLLDIGGKGLAVSWADLNADLAPELYVANDMTPNFLFTIPDLKAGSPVTYRNVADIGGTAQSGEGMNAASMGIACADFDGDSLPDLFVTDYYNMQKTLYKNHGDLQFEDVSRRMKTAQTGYAYLGFGTVPLDYNGDGFDDLFVANGHVLGPEVKPDRMRSQLLLNNGGKHFEDVTPKLSGYFQKEWLGRGAATADFDNDGDLDIVVTHLDDPAALLRNSTPTGKRFIGFELTTSTRIHPSGTRVTVTTAEGKQSRSLMDGGSYLSSSEGRVLFLVSPQEQRVDVRVDWASGRVDEFTALELSRYWHISEGRQPW